MVEEQIEETVPESAPPKKGFVPINRKENQIVKEVNGVTSNPNQTRVKSLRGNRPKPQIGTTPHGLTIHE